MTPLQARKTVLIALRRTGLTWDEAGEVVECFAARMRTAGAEQAAATADPTRAELIETIVDLVSQDCPADTAGLLDSAALSSYADPYGLARCGRVELVSEAGRMVRARWKQ